MSWFGWAEAKIYGDAGDNHGQTYTDSGSASIYPEKRKENERRKPRESDVDAGHSYELPSDIKYLWRGIHFLFSDGKSTKASQTFHKSLCLDIGKVQFSLTGNRRKETKDILKQHGVALYRNDEHEIHIEIKEHSSQMNNSLNSVEHIFERHVLFDYERVILDLNSFKGKSLIRKLKTHMPTEMRIEKVTVFFCRATDSLVVVGEKQSLHKMFADMGLQTIPVQPAPSLSHKIRTLDKPLSANDSILLARLGFADHIRNTFPGSNAEVRQDPPSCCLVIHGDSSLDVEDEVRTFLSRVKIQTLKFSHDLCLTLFFDNFPFPNEDFYTFIKKEIPRSIGKDVGFYINRSQNGYFQVNCISKGKAKKIAEVVENSIIHMRTKLNTGEVCWKTLDEFSMRKKFAYEQTSPGVIQLYCTSDVHDTLQKIFVQDEIQSVYLDLNRNQHRFLKEHRHDLLSYIQTRFNVQAFLVPEELRLSGRAENLKESDEYLRNELNGLQSSIHVDIPSECIKDRHAVIDKEMTDKMCVWDLNNSNKPKHMLMNCDYLVSWADPLRNLKVTVVTGCSWHINVDLQIVMTNQCLYPIEMSNLPIQVPTDFISQGKTFLESGKKLDVGNYVEFPREVEGSKNKHTVALVVTSDTYDPSGFHAIDIKGRVDGILKMYARRNIKTVAISANAGEILTSTVEAATHATCGVEELFICCQLNQAKVLQNVTEIFKDKRGYLMKIYSNASTCHTRERSGIKIQIKEGWLHEMKADAIVNSTNTALKLNMGLVSSKILEMAGKSLNDECRNKYPYGLLPGEVAVTKAHNLRDIKHIYHISLETFNYVNYREDVENFVLKCLCQAERDGCESIAFPALGVGGLEYPRRETATAMFGAVERFSSEIMNPVLKSVTFAVNVNDKLTYEAFQNEEWRRSKRCLNETGFTTSFVKDDFKSQVYTTGPKSPSIKIATLADFWIPPAYAVEIFFLYDEFQPTLCRKRAFDTPPTWNDQWFLYGVADEAILAERLSQLFVELENQGDRITMIVFYTNKDYRLRMAEEKQAENIFGILSSRKDRYLQEVVILLSDEMCMQHTVELLLKEKQIYGEWKENTSCRSTISIDVIGKTTACLNDGEVFVNHLLQELNDEIRLKLVSRIRKVYEEKMKEQQQLTHVAMDGQVDVEVTAEINKGIVNFKRTKSNWGMWVTNVQKAFRLKMNISPENNVTVTGDFDSILKFELYLDNGFPWEISEFEGASITPYDKTRLDSGTYVPTVVEMTEYEYKCLCYAYPLTELFKGEQVGQVEYNIICKYMVITCKEHSKDKLKNIIQRVLDNYRKYSASLLVNEMVVHVKTGEITTEEGSECIAVPSQGNLGQIVKTPHGIIGQLVAVGGSPFVEALKKSHKDEGCLKEGNCRIVEAHNTPLATKVVCVHVGQLKSRGGKSELMRTISATLRKTDDSGVHILTLPLIGSGSAKEGLPLIECMGQYMRALCNFQEERLKERTLTEIVIVDRNKNRVEQIRKFLRAIYIALNDIQQEQAKEATQEHSVQMGLAIERVVLKHTEFDLYHLSAHKRQGMSTSTLSTVGFPIPKTHIKLFVAKGKPWDVQADVVLCFVNERFEYVGDKTENILSLGPSSYKHEYNSKVGSQFDSHDIVSIDCRGGSLTCHTVLHAVFTNFANTSKQSMRPHIEEIIMNVVDKCKALDAKTLAVPIIEGEDQMSRSGLCNNFVRGIFATCQSRPNTLSKIHLMTDEEECLDYICDEIQNVAMELKNLEH